MSRDTRAVNLRARWHALRRPARHYDAQRGCGTACRSDREGVPAARADETGCRVWPRPRGTWSRARTTRTTAYGQGCLLGRACRCRTPIDFTTGRRSVPRQLRGDGEVGCNGRRARRRRRHCTTAHGGHHLQHIQARSLLERPACTCSLGGRASAQQMFLLNARLNHRLARGYKINYRLPTFTFTTCTCSSTDDT